MKTPLGDLGLGQFVLDVVPAARVRGTANPPSFRPCLLWPRLPSSATTELLSIFLSLDGCKSRLLCVSVSDTLLHVYFVLLLANHSFIASA